MHHLLPGIDKKAFVAFCEQFAGKRYMFVLIDQISQSVDPEDWLAVVRAAAPKHARRQGA